jgi:UDP-N-acetylmuramyl pentapeptide phosphotransferase/UDP-N-acetylglucosamine-1-phosphate transferase
VILLVLVLAVFLATVALTRVVLGALRRRAVLDRPNERSSHSVPTPRGGGIAIVATVLPAWALAVALGLAPPAALAAAAGALLLAALSFLDDLRDLPAGLRLAGQLVAVALCLPLLPGAGHVFQGLLPRWLDLAAAGLLWLWFVNLYNFMDGIDGIAGTETACAAGGLALVVLLAGGAPGHPAIAALALPLAAAGAGFLVWNWHPARIFMGDVGSVPLGFLLGWLLLAAAASGLWAPALILPLYYLADASWTLGRRLLRGERIWQAHREHFYQRAVQAGLSHDAVVLRVLAADLALVGAAALSLGRPAAALALAAAIVAALCAELRRARR